MKMKGSRSQFLASLGCGVVVGAVPAPALASLRNEVPARFGLKPPTDVVYTVWASSDFRGYSIPVGGDVERQFVVGITDLRDMSQQTQIARLSCAKGLNAIRKWRGVPLRTIIAMARPMLHARFVVVHGFDRDSDGTPFYETLDLQQARDSQTMLALELEDRPLDADHGGPVRLLAPAQAGYKSVKWIRRIDVVSSLSSIGGGKGGYWEDRGVA
jgi:DMSO/TMAO reductase YedYZ molybdopterin-dependent catalytic subunit